MPKKILAVFFVISIIIFGTIRMFAADKTIELNVSAAISLKDALQEIQKLYLQKQPNLKLNFNLNSSGALQTQIEQGAPADIFISAAVKQMDALEKKGLVKKESRKNLLENQLVLIIPKNFAPVLKDFQDLTLDSMKKIAIGAPESVPAGQYAQEVLKNLNLWDKLQGKIVFGTNVRAVLTYVETGNVDAGIVYRTDAAVSDRVKIVAAAPGGSHEPIIYPAAIMTNAAQPKEAAGFLAFLSGPESKAVFEKYGFMIGK